MSRSSIALSNLRAVVIVIVLAFHSVLAYLASLPLVPYRFESPPVYFTLREGEENDWLVVRAVNLAEGTVTVCLKQPMMRIRNLGVEVVLSFDAHGVKTPPVTVAANPLPASARTGP